MQEGGGRKSDRKPIKDWRRSQGRKEKKKRRRNGREVGKIEERGAVTAALHTSIWTSKHATVRRGEGK